jgi:hypothetical protein
MFPLSSPRNDESSNLSDLLQPLPVFFLVTLLTGPIYGIPSFQEVVEAITVLSFGSTL